MGKELEIVECKKCGKQTSNHRGVCLKCGASLKEVEVKPGIDERDVGSSCEGGGCPVR